MRKGLKRLTALLLVVCCLLALASCGQTAAEEPNETQFTIGVACYDPDSAEMEMFMSYYRDYIAEGFPVEFFFSGKINSAEDEQQFIRDMKKQGADGIISFYGNDIEPVLETCAEEEMYYVLASGTIADATFEKVCDNPWFLGTIGPDPLLERQAGSNMASYFWNQGARRFLVLSGGAAMNNYMHFARTRGMLEALAEAGGFTYEQEAMDLAITEDTITLQVGGAEITIAPGYLSNETGRANIQNALSGGDFDALLSSYYVDTLIPDIAAREAEIGHSIRTGTIDFFSESNFEIIREKDAYGNVQIDYIEGKYASMAGPAFAALYNAMNGDLDVVCPDGKAFRLYQGFWTAASPEEYVEMYGYTTGIYENAYSCADLMTVIRAYREDADFDAFQTLTEAYDIDAVKARILGH